jgi:hypothetical protein
MFEIFGNSFSVGKATFKSHDTEQHFIKCLNETGFVETELLPPKPPKNHPAREWKHVASGTKVLPAGTYCYQYQPQGAHKTPDFITIDDGRLFKIELKSGTTPDDIKYNGGIPHVGYLYVLCTKTDRTIMMGDDLLSYEGYVGLKALYFTDVVMGSGKRFGRGGFRYGPRADHFYEVDHVTIAREQDSWNKVKRLLTGTPYQELFAQVNWAEVGPMIEETCVSTAAERNLSPEKVEEVIGRVKIFMNKEFHLSL